MKLALHCGRTVEVGRRGAEKEGLLPLLPPFVEALCVRRMEEDLGLSDEVGVAVTDDVWSDDASGEIEVTGGCSLFPFRSVSLGFAVGPAGFERRRKSRKKVIFHALLDC